MWNIQADFVCILIFSVTNSSIAAQQPGWLSFIITTVAFHVISDMKLKSLCFFTSVTLKNATHSSLYIFINDTFLLLFCHYKTLVLHSVFSISCTGLFESNQCTFLVCGRWGHPASDAKIAWVICLYRTNAVAMKQWLMLVVMHMGGWLWQNESIATK